MKYQGKIVVTAWLIGLLLSGMMLLATHSDIMLHKEGKKAIYEKDWGRAIRLFQQIDTRFPGSTRSVVLVSLQPGKTKQRA